MRYLVLLLSLLPVSSSNSTKPTLKDVIKFVNPSVQQHQAEIYAYTIVKYGKRYGINPHLIAAIISVESRFNPWAIGSIGEIGLMQLRPEFHGPKQSLFNIDNNIHTGVRYLSKIKKYHKKKYPDYKWVELYNRGPSSRPKKFIYTRKVMRYVRVFQGV